MDHLFAYMCNEALSPPFYLRPRFFFNFVFSFYPFFFVGCGAWQRVKRVDIGLELEIKIEIFRKQEGMGVIIIFFKCFTKK